MSIESEVSRIIADRDTIRSKFVELGISQPTDDISKLAEASEMIVNQGEISETINGLKETSVTIPAGYTSGGTVTLGSEIEEALSLI